MKRTLVMAAFIALVAGLGILRADDSNNGPAVAVSPMQQSNEYIWFQEHQAAIAKDPEAAGVIAVLRAVEFLQDKDPQTSIDFFNRILTDTHDMAVKRQVRLTLSDLYRKVNQQDKALEQLQQLMME
jgi:ABC-type sugar transport system substrate-binding protein